MEKAKNVKEFVERMDNMKKKKSKGFIFRSGFDDCNYEFDFN